jgi:murein DD-endopeptidase MepM/ murein hydrolase activator NlpD
MREKFLSVIVIPHRRGSHRTYSISKNKFKTAAGITVGIFVLITVFMVDYFLMRGTRDRYEDLRADFEQKNETLEKYRNSIDDLNKKIEEFENYREKLNIIAGLKSEEVMKANPGIGGGGGQDFGAVNPNSDLGQLQNLGMQAQGLEQNFNLLNSHFSDQALELAQTPSVAPTQGYWSSPYGYRNDPFTGQRAFHSGVDIATQSGNPVIATADGVVIKISQDKTGGRTVKINHPKTGYNTIYCHLSTFLVKQGQKVKRGDTIGLVGMSGRARGPHVHYEIHLNNKALNPWYYILDN